MIMGMGTIRMRGNVRLVFNQEGKSDRSRG